MKALIDYKITNEGVQLVGEEGREVTIPTLDALLLKDLLARDREVLEHQIFTEGPEPEQTPVVYAELRARTEELLKKMKEFQAKQLHPPRLAVCPHCDHMHDVRYVEQCQFNPLRNTVIKLPCPKQCAVAGCGRQATEALSVAHPSEPGAYIIRPLCGTCACLPDRWTSWIVDQTSQVEGSERVNVS